MKYAEKQQWIEKNEKRKQIMLSLKQPMTAMQLSEVTGLSPDQCSLSLGQLAQAKLVKCLNPTARRSRLYWLTPIGIMCQRKLLKEKGIEGYGKNLPDIDWELYGWVCYNHRTAIIKALTQPMQPVEIKKRAKQRNPELKMSANNVRDSVRLFKQKKIVRSVLIPKKIHLRYELTDVGKKMQELLGGVRQCV